MKTKTSITLALILFLGAMLQAMPPKKEAEPKKNFAAGRDRRKIDVPDPSSGVPRSSAPAKIAEPLAAAVQDQVDDETENGGEEQLMIIGERYHTNKQNLMKQISQAKENYRSATSNGKTIMPGSSISDPNNSDRKKLILLCQQLTALDVQYLKSLSATQEEARRHLAPTIERYQDGLRGKDKEGEIDRVEAKAMLDGYYSVLN